MTRKKYKYPIYKQSRSNGCVVKFFGMQKGIIVKDTEESRNLKQKIGLVKKYWIEHTNNLIWKEYNKGETK